MNRPTTLLWRILLDVGLQHKDAITRDFQEIESRYRSEGMSFLTIALPRLDDALTKALSNGRLTRDMYEGFRSRTRHGSLPALLSGFFRRIFDEDGWLLTVPDVDAIFAIRQVTRLFKKVELPCSAKRVRHAYERYVTNDQEMDWSKHRDTFDDRIYSIVCGFLWSDLERLSHAIYCMPGKFGSGATGERYKLNQRHTVLQWPERAEWLFPASAHAVSSEDSPDLENINWISSLEEHPVRVTQVPKTLKTPRTISIEPSYMMLMQQSVLGPLVKYLESPDWGFQSIRFTDQTVNRSLARRGSLDGELSTIDLSDASDLVSNDLVIRTFESCAPTFLNLIQTSRTRTALLPDGSTIELKKFASMGSALCFPIEAMIFFSIVMYTLVHESGKRPSRHLLRNLAKDVAVYGDDIIVRSSMAPEVMKNLEAFGLKVNHDKSFHTGLFRESCGGDYYKGENVTPAYVRQWDDSGTHVSKSLLVDYVSLSNTFYMKGLWHAAQYIRDLVDDSRIPNSRYPIGGLHWTSFLSSGGLRWNSGTQSLRVRVRGIRSSKQPDPILSISGGLLLHFGSRPRRDGDSSFLEETGQRISEVPYGYRHDNHRYNGTREAWLNDNESLGQWGGPPSKSFLRKQAVYGGSTPTRSYSAEIELNGEPPETWHSRKTMSSVPAGGIHSVRPHSRSLKSGWCLTPEVIAF